MCSLRELVRHLGPQMGVDFVVENVRGGGGVRAMSRLANSPADGSVFYAATPSFIFTSLMSNPSIGFDDLDPIVNLFSDQEVVYTRTESPFENPCRRDPGFTFGKRPLGRRDTRIVGAAGVGTSQARGGRGRRDRQP